MLKDAIQKSGGDNWGKVKISKAIDTIVVWQKVCKKNIAKYNLNAIHVLNEIMRERPKRESKELPEKSKCHYTNIHLNKGKYPQSGDEDLNGNTIYLIQATLAKFMQTSPNNKTQTMKLCHRVPNRWSLP